MSIPPIGYGDQDSNRENEREHEVTQQDQENSLDEKAANSADLPPNPVQTADYRTQTPQQQYGQYGEANSNVQNFTSGYRTVIPMRPLGIGDTIDGVIRLLKFNPVALILFPLLVAVVFAIIDFAVSLLGGQAMLFSPDIASTAELTAFDSFSGFDMGITSLGVFGVTTLISLLIMTVESAIISIATTRTIIASVRGYRLTLRDTWNIVRPRFWSLFLRIIALSSIVSIATFVLVMVPVIIFAVVFSMGMESGSPNGFAAFAAVLVFFVIIFCAIVIYLRLMIASAALVAEDCGPIKAIKRSWHLTRGSFWHIAALMLFTLIFVFVIFFVISLFTGILVGLFGYSDSTAMFIITTIIPVIGVLLVQIFIYPVFSALINLVYVNMRFKRENFHQQLLFEASQASGSASNDGNFPQSQTQDPKIDLG